MVKKRRQSRKFSGIGYREVQKSNSIRRSQLPKNKQIWLKENGYKNIGWDYVIRLYQKINDLLIESNSDEPTLEELFLNADHIGKKYQTNEEIKTFNQQMTTIVNEISTIIDQQFPENEIQVIDFSQKGKGDFFK